nr:zinc finger, CCHC-type [Tanacetum cinerariifolium]
MSTLVINNLVYKNFLDKVKLTRPNFIDRYRNLMIMLSIKDMLNYMEHPIPVAHVPASGQVVPPDVLSAHTTWVKDFKEIVGPMLITMTLPNKYVALMLDAIRAGRIQKNNHKNMKPQMAAKGNNQGKGKTKLVYAPAYAPKPNIPPPLKKDNHAKDTICHQCGEVGHWRRNCPGYFAELMRKKKLS